MQTEEFSCTFVYNGHNCGLVRIVNANKKKHQNIKVQKRVLGFFI